MTTHFNYSLQNFSMNNAKVLTGNSQPVPDFIFYFKNCDFCNLLRLPASPILKIQKFPVGMLILMQKPF